MDNSKPIGFVSAMLHFFGKKPGQTTTGFADEIKALDDKDRAYFREGLEKNGYVLA